MWKVLLVLVAALAVGWQYSVSQKPGRDFSYGECVAAYDKFGSDRDILEKLKYKDKAEERYGKYTDNKLTISVTLLKDKVDFNNYLLMRQVTRYIGCISHI